MVKLILLHYRFLKKTGYYKLFYPISILQSPEIISKNTEMDKKKFNLKNISRKDCLEKADEILESNFTWFGYKKYNLDNPPNWFQDPFTTKKIDGNLHWSKINSYPNLDIKKLWELSRWNWAPTLARAYKLTNDKKYYECLVNNINNWCKKNKYNAGPNWLCGQEVSIRLINFFLVCIIS